MLVVVLIRVQPAGGVIVGVPLEACAAIVATMTSLACVPGAGGPEGLLRLSDVALLAVPLLFFEAARNPMIGGTGHSSSTSQSFAAARHTAPALPGGC